MRLLAIPLIIALAVAGWTAYWFFAAGQVERGIDAWIADQQAGGAQISHAGLTVSGYPYRIQVDIAEPSFALPQHPQQPHWKADTLSAISHPWTPDHVIVDLSGRHTLAAVVDEQSMTWELTSPNTRASWQSSGNGQTERVSLDLRDGILTENGTERLRAQRLQLHVRPAPDDPANWQLAFDAEQAIVHWPIPAAIGSELARARGQLTLNGRPLLASKLPEAVAAWRDAGGTVDVQALAIEWGRLSLQGDGTLALDASMRPIGALTAKVKGYDALLDMARDDGQLSDGGARAAKAVLGLLAAGNGGMLSVPVRLQNGDVFLGPVLVARLRPLFPAP